MRVNEARIFLCYAREDILAVKAVYQQLIKAGFSPWMDKKDLLLGQNWRMETSKALKTARFVMIFFSKQSVAKRGYVQREYKLALDTLEEMPEGKLFIIPVRLNECEIPERFSDIHYCDLFEKEGFELVLRTFRSQLELSPNDGQLGVSLQEYRDLLKEFEKEKQKNLHILSEKRRALLQEEQGKFQREAGKLDRTKLRANDKRSQKETGTKNQSNVVIQTQNQKLKIQQNHNKHKRLIPLVWRACILLSVITGIFFSSSHLDIFLPEREPGIYLKSDGEQGDKITEEMIEIVSLPEDVSTADRPYDFQKDLGNNSCLTQSVTTNRPLNWSDVGPCK
ncbi:MAG: toll/interleukin-1 receptor domain-containing protein [Calditrichia bacterium]